MTHSEQPGRPVAGESGDAGGRPDRAEPTTGPLPPVPQVAPTGPPTMLGSLQHMRTALGDLRLDLVVPGVDAARADRQAMIAQLDDYILPRLSSVDAPLLAVVGGSTGAGKSTLVNSLLGFPASRSGVIRPTTRAPILVYHPADAGYFADQRILPTLARAFGEVFTAENDPITAVQLISTEAIPRGLALLDAPDIDSVVGSNRALATQLLAAADLWVFVTTAARYADAVPWDFLAGAAARQAAVAIVLDRVPPEATNDVAGHLRWMLQQNGLGGSPLFVIPEAQPDRVGLLPAAVVQPVKAWLGDLAHNAAARQAVVRQTLTGAIDALLGRVQSLAGAGDQQRQAIAALAAQVDEVYSVAAQRVAEGLADGSLLRTEVLARWQEFLGTGEFMRNLESRIGRLRDRVVSAVSGKPRQAAQVGDALQSGVEQLIASQIALAADEVMRRWQNLPAGAALANDHPELARTAPGLPDRVSRSVRDWQGQVLDMVRSEGKDKRTAARILSYGVNGTGVALMLVTFSQTAGLSGAEVGIAGGTAVLAQRLLEAVFGDQAVRTLVITARTDLVDRSTRIMNDDRRRLDELLRGLSSGPTPFDLMGLAGVVATTR